MILGSFNYQEDILKEIMASFALNNHRFYATETLYTQKVFISTNFRHFR